jgi:hypothetical protein
MPSLINQNLGGALSLNYNYLVNGQRDGGISLANRTAAGGGKQNHLNLTSLLKSSNILDEDGIEDLHFYFVSFNQHKNSILKLRERFEGKLTPSSPQMTGGL